MNLKIIKTLFIKDFSLYFKNRLFTLLTLLGLIFYVIFFSITPKTVDEVMEIGIYAKAIPPVIQEIKEEGVEFKVFKTEEELKDAISEEKIVAGLVFPQDLLEKLLKKEKPTIKVYFSSESSKEIKDAMTVMVGELIFSQIGYKLDIDVKEEIIGPDMVGSQIPPRKRLVPLLVFLIIMVETFGIANLISEEIERKTIQALLVTPATIKDIFIAKGLMSFVLAFFQAILFLILIGSIQALSFAVVVTLLLGAMLITGVGFLIGSKAKDFMGVIAWGALSMIILLLPSLNIILPGIIAGNWIKILPTYYFVEPLYKIMNFGYGLKDVLSQLLILTIYAFVLLTAGIYVLKRRYQ